jgi:hypothetical protein
MKEHLKNLIERLSNYSEKLDKIALFADKKWVLIDEEGNQQSYIFERDGDLVMSKNGKVKMGKWKFYPEAQSIKIDRIEDQILLNQAFFDKALMVLKYDGIKNDDLFILADQNQIKDLNIENYLENIENLKNNKVIQLKDRFTGEEIMIKHQISGVLNIGDQVFDGNGKIINLGKYKLNSLSVITVENGKVNKISMF